MNKTFPQKRRASSVYVKKLRSNHATKFGKTHRLSHNLTRTVPFITCNILQKSFYCSSFPVAVSDYILQPGERRKKCLFMHEFVDFCVGLTE